MKIFTVEEMRAAEANADADGHSYADMMEMAGFGLAQAIARKWPIKSQKFLVLVGPGNNGGDALVAGRYLYQMGADVLFYLYSRQRDSQDPNFARALDLDLPLIYDEDDPDDVFFEEILQDVGFIIDGLLGVGLSRPLNDRIRRLLNRVEMGLEGIPSLPTRSEESTIYDLIPAYQPEQKANPKKTRASRPRPNVIAVDCPTGLYCDSGQLDPDALKADLTVTFGGPKPGHFLAPGSFACGEINIIDIGLLDKDSPSVETQLVTPKIIQSWLPARPVDGHKGKFGRVLMLAGSDKYQGAPLFAAKAALRTGSGLVELLIPHSVHATAIQQLPEGIYPTSDGNNLLSERDGETAAAWLNAEKSRHQAALIGPGLGNAKSFFQALILKNSRIPMVIDADGLNLLAQVPTWWETLPANTVLTPHPGEMARLLDIPPRELKSLNRIDLARDMAAKWGVILLLKGAYTVIASPDGKTYVLPFANPLLATAGSGDVLAGIIASLMGQGVSPLKGTVVAGYLHGLAGEVAAQSFGDRGLLASELIDYLPEAIKRLNSHAVPS